MGRQFFTTEMRKTLRDIKRERRIDKKAKDIGIDRGSLSDAIEKGHASDAVANKIIRFLAPGKESVDVITATCEHFKIESADLAKHTIARQVAAHILRIKNKNEPAVSWKDIATLLGFKDHTGAIKAQQMVLNQLKSCNHEYTLPVTRIMDRAGL